MLLLCIWSNNTERMSNLDILWYFTGITHQMQIFLSIYYENHSFEMLIENGEIRTAGDNGETAHCSEVWGGGEGVKDRKIPRFATDILRTNKSNSLECVGRFSIFPSQKIRKLISQLSSPNMLERVNFFEHSPPPPPYLRLSPIPSRGPALR